MLSQSAFTHQQSEIHHGPVPPGSRDITSVHDMDISLYYAFVAYLIDYYNDSAYHLSRKGSKAQGVKVACQGEQRTSGVHPYTKVMLPRTHPIFGRKSSIPEISRVSTCTPFPS